MLVNPDYVDPAKLPPMFNSWDILIAPRPDPPSPFGLALSSLTMQPLDQHKRLMLDPKRVVVEASQKTLISALRNWGFEPIPCPFLSYAPFGGSFHCATLDIRRRGELETYF